MGPVGKEINRSTGQRTSDLGPVMSDVPESTMAVLTAVTLSPST